MIFLCIRYTLRQKDMDRRFVRDIQSCDFSGKKREKRREKRRERASGGKIERSSIFSSSLHFLSFFFSFLLKITLKDRETAVKRERNGMRVDDRRFMSSQNTIISLPSSIWSSSLSVLASCFVNERKRDKDKPWISFPRRRS